MDDREVKRLMQLAGFKNHGSSPYLACGDIGDFRRLIEISKKGVGDQRNIRLWDTQWMNIMNADYSGMSKEDAINQAVKATEQQMAANYKDDKWPSHA